MCSLTITLLKGLLHFVRFYIENLPPVYILKLCLLIEHFVLKHFYPGGGGGGGGGLPYEMDGDAPHLT